MIDKLCVCGHAMEDRGAQTLEMNGSCFGNGLSTDYVDVELYICPWCGRMAFFEPEEMRLERFTELHRGKSDEELREIVNGDYSPIEKQAAKVWLDKYAEDAAWEAEQERKEAEKREKRRKFFAGLLGKDEEDGKPTKNRPPEF